MYYHFSCVIREASEHNKSIPFCKGDVENTIRLTCVPFATNKSIFLEHSIFSGKTKMINFQG